MSQGRFEKMFMVLVALGLVIGCLTLWSDGLFSDFNEPSVTTNLTVLNQTNEVSNQLQIMYDKVKTSSWVPLVDILFVGWQVLNLVFSMIITFLAMPLTITALIIPDEATVTLVGWSLEVIYLGLMVWGLVALLIRNPEGTT